jgi:hypothetical protein
MQHFERGPTQILSSVWEMITLGGLPGALPISSRHGARWGI